MRRYSFVLAIVLAVVLIGQWRAQAVAGALTQTPLVTPTQTPLVTPTQTPLVTPTQTPLVTPTPSLTAISTPTVELDANPDGLYSAVASVSGTVAAILGGFVLAALLNLASQRESKVELLRERKRTIGDVEVRLHKQEHDNARTLNDLVLQWLRLSFVSEDVVPSLDNLCKRLEAVIPSWPESAIVRLAEDYLVRRQQAERVVRDTYREMKPDKNRSAFTSWSAIHAPPDADIEFVKDAFDHRVASVRRQESLARHISRAGIPSDISEGTATILANTETVIRGWDTSAPALALARLQEELAELASRERELADELAAFRMPPYLGAGVVLFVFMMTIGVILPLALMPSQAGSTPLVIILVVKAGVVAQVVAATIFMIMLLRIVKGGAP